jgi:hypothetical protein
VAGIQESKWSGSDVWQAGGCTFLHSGRSLAGVDERATRNEGVGIVLDDKASRAWRNAGEQWEAVSSRLVTAGLQWNSGKGSARNSRVCLSVLCAYAPTAKAPFGVKEKFYIELQNAIGEVPESDILVIFGRFQCSSWRLGS